eukprot:FR738564.1.p2 GENE.FR738564.1~~FR738564.1.p2  ORF type:complete len:114 (-),score=26.46 FR738564.1:573-914(-)
MWGLLPPLGPPRVFPFFVSGLVLWWGIGAGIQFSPRETALVHDYAKAAQLTLIKGDKKVEVPRGGGPSRTSGSPWLWTLAVTLGGRRFLYVCNCFFFGLVVFEGRGVIMESCV